MNMLNTFSIRKVSLSFCILILNTLCRTPVRLQVLHLHIAFVYRILSCFAFWYILMNAVRFLYIIVVCILCNMFVNFVFLIFVWRFQVLITYYGFDLATLFNIVIAFFRFILLWVMFTEFLRHVESACLGLYVKNVFIRLRIDDIVIVRLWFPDAIICLKQSLRGPRVKFNADKSFSAFWKSFGKDVFFAQIANERVKSARTMKRNLWIASLTFS